MRKPKKPPTLPLIIAPRVADAFKTLMKRRKISQETAARMMRERSAEPWPQSRVWKLLHNRTGIKINDAELLAHVLGSDLITLIREASESGNNRMLMAVTDQEKLLIEDFRLLPARMRQEIRIMIAASRRYLDRQEPMHNGQLDVEKDSSKELTSRPRSDIRRV